MKPIILIASILIALTGFTQERTTDDILAQREVLRPVFLLKTGMTDALVLNMSYGHNDLISETDRRLLKEVQVVSIDLVFTDFPKGEDLKALNRTRIEKIFGLRKDLVTDPEIRWNIIRQTGCSNEAEAKVLFHGVVIHYRPQQDKETIERDVKLLSELPPTGDSLKRMVKRELPYGIKLNDSTVIKALERNKQWKDMLIVCDMTGSMTPYTTQLLVWFQLKMTDKRVRRVVFFNDGDSKPESAKEIGRIGGIYMAKTASYEEILKTATQTIRNGCGGDAPENNCEALLRGIDSVPLAKDIILIADNLADIKDIKLMKKINKPVHVILCGTEFFPLNSQYLDLARATGGSVHTMTEDLTNLAAMNDGATVRIAGSTYKLIAGAFVKVLKI